MFYFCKALLYALLWSSLYILVYSLDYEIYGLKSGTLFFMVCEFILWTQITNQPPTITKSAVWMMIMIMLKFSLKQHLAAASPGTLYFHFHLYCCFYGNSKRCITLTVGVCLIFVWHDTTWSRLRLTFRRILVVSKSAPGLSVIGTSLISGLYSEDTLTGHDQKEIRSGEIKGIRLYQKRHPRSLKSHDDELLTLTNGMM